MSDYEELLDRAIKQIPPQARETKRFSVPKAYSIIQGNRTIVRNFGEITQAMNRDSQHVLKFLLRELGTAGNLEGNRAIMQGKFTHYLINDRMEDYVQRFITCQECNSPDTKIIREDRIFILKCEACGAKAPLKTL